MDWNLARAHFGLLWVRWFLWVRLQPDALATMGEESVRQMPDPRVQARDQCRPNPISPTIRRSPSCNRAFTFTTGDHYISACTRNRSQRSMQSSSISPLGAKAEITQLLRRWQNGEDAAREQLVELVYDQVRAIARGAIRQHPGATLSATDLAHEALMRLLGEQADWEDRRHFYNVIAKATRQILVDAARRRQRHKRGGGMVPETLSAAENVAVSEDENLLRLNEAIEQLIQRDARSAQVIELTYFGGLGRAEVASALGLSVPTIDRDLRFGRAWLKRALEA